MSTTAMIDREKARLSWLENMLSQFENLVLLAGDASFRRYFRVHSKGKSFVLMDAPPNLESCKAFIKIDEALRSIGLHAPEIFCADSEQGFLLLEDFGDTQLLGALTDESVDTYYNNAFDSLLSLSQCQTVQDYQLPAFDESRYEHELNLFQDWYLKCHLKLDLSRSDRQLLDRINQLLIESAISQPQVFVHRDFHSRNLMVLPDDQLGILDFQDAVRGPITYDLMSLLRDCYIEWPYDRVKSWALQFHQQCLEKNLLSEDNPEEFLFWCDWIALQRHLKCIGIFSRLHYRDNKSSYLTDIPRVIRYVRSVCQRHEQFAPLLERFIP